MRNYDDLVKFRNKLTNDTDYIIFEEDCQLLDRVLDDYEQKETRIAELEKENQKLKFERNKIAIEKLEELRERFDYAPRIFFKDTELSKSEIILLKDDYEYLKYIFRDNIDSLIKELKEG